MRVRIIASLLILIAATTALPQGVRQRSTPHPVQLPADWKIDSYARLLVNSDALDRLKRGDSVEDVIRSWNTSLENFRRIRERVLIYR